MRECFAENRHVFLWKLSGERACDVWWSGHLGGHMIFGKSINITQPTVDNALALVLLAGLLWASLIADDTIALVHFAFSFFNDLCLLCFIEKSALKNFWWCSGCFL